MRSKSLKCNPGIKNNSRNNESEPGARSCMISSQIQRHKLSTYCIKCNDHPCDNFVFPGDSTEKIYTDQQKVRDEPDIIEDTAEILMPEKSDNDGNKMTEEID